MNIKYTKIWFENCEQQPKLVHEEKQNIFNESIDCYSAKYNIQNFKVIRLLIGGR